MSKLKFNFSVVAFCFAFLLCAGKSQAVAFSYSGTCYPDAPSALAAFVNSFPKVMTGANGITIYTNDPVSIPSITPTGFLTYTLDETYPAMGAGTGIVDPTATLQLPVCSATTATVVSNSSVVIVCAAVVLAMMGFAAGKGYK